jgi:hypothetical protein
VDLVLAVLHVYQRAIVAVKELRIALAAPAGARLFENEMVLAIAREYAIVTLALHKVGIGLHDGLEVNAQVDIFLHNSINF